MFLCTMSTHPSTAGLCSGLDDLSCSGWEGDSGSLGSAAPGDAEEGRLWPADTCSLSPGSDSEEGGCDSRAEPSINSSCHNLEGDQRSNVSNKASERERSVLIKMPFARTYLWEQRVWILTGRWRAVLQETGQQNKSFNISGIKLKTLLLRACNLSHSTL